MSTYKQVDRLANSLATAEWNEADHPRDQDGKFGDGGGGGGKDSTKPEPQRKESGLGPSTHKVPKDLQERTAIQTGDRVWTDKPGMHQMSPGALQKHLTGGSFSTFTAANPMGQKQPQAVNERLMAQLKKELIEAGAIFHEVDGIYNGNHEPSYLVHHVGRITPDFVERLGNKYNQESVLHFTQDKTTIRYVSGENMGKDMLNLEGHNNDPAPDVPQTSVPGAGKFSVGAEQKPKAPQFGFVIKTDDGQRRQITFGSK